MFPTGSIHISRALCNRFSAYWAFCRYLISVRFLGCYKEAKGARIFAVSAGTYDPSNLTPQTCADACLRWGYRYAALTQGQFCFCNSNLPPTAAVPGGYCNMLCSGNSQMTCGAQNYIRWTKQTNLQLLYVILCRKLFWQQSRLAYFLK